MFWGGERKEEKKTGSLMTNWTTNADMHRLK
jgi:hypothetical protein